MTARGISKVENARYKNVTTTLSDAEWAQLNEWIGRQDPKPSRSAAVRSFVLAGLKSKGAGAKLRK